MEPGRMEYMILSMQENWKTRVQLVKEVQHNIKMCGIKTEDIGNREIYRRKMAVAKAMTE